MGSVIFEARVRTFSHRHSGAIDVFKQRNDRVRLTSERLLLVMAS